MYEVFGVSENTHNEMRGGLDLENLVTIEI
jgi:hypothetical protein